MFLLFDTSTERGIVAVFKGSEMLFHTQLSMGYQSSQNLLSTVQSVLLQAGATCSQLDFLAVGVGPGSYTGIRIAAAAAKTLSFACSLPVVGFCSLQGFIPSRDASFAAVIDAKIGGMYVQIGNKSGGTVVFSSKPQVVPLARAWDVLKETSVMVTPSAVQLKSKLTAIFPELPIAWEEKWPDPQFLGKLAWKKFQAKEYFADHRFDLLYLRKTQAEIEKEGRNLS